MTEREFNHMINVLENEEDFWATRLMNADRYADRLVDDAAEHKECVHILTELREKKLLFVNQTELEL